VSYKEAFIGFDILQQTLLTEQSNTLEFDVVEKVKATIHQVSQDETS